MINNVKTIAKELVNGVLGLIIGVFAYIGFYHYNSLFIKCTMLVGLYFVVSIWRKSYSNSNKQTIVINEEDHIQEKKVS